ncbi:MAG: membrane protein insertion efficiency factor YidD [Rhodospirillales bacterium]|nr:membrane protein insertion efficiency factor YidD [Rhodospirillales bacterium]
MKVISRILTGIMTGLIRGYQLLVSPFLPVACRYHPCCSAYGLEALRRHGPLAGPWLILHRLVRCQPWGGSGLDPVPDVSPFARLERLLRGGAYAADAPGKPAVSLRGGRGA